LDATKAATYAAVNTEPLDYQEMALESRTNVLKTPQRLNVGSSSLKKVIFRTGFRKDLGSKL
jgi:hypothetical protein